MQVLLYRLVSLPNPDNPWGDGYYKCEHVTSGVATGATWPVPPCFEDRTDKTTTNRGRLKWARGMPTEAP